MTDKVDAPVPASDCGGEAGTIQSVDVSPMPPVSGQDVTIRAVSKTSRAFNINKMAVTAYVFGVPVHTLT